MFFFAGGVYECTINDSRGRYSQSQHALMNKIPLNETVERYDAIQLWISPSGTQVIPYNFNNVPTDSLLENNGWNNVYIGVAPERIISTRGGMHAKRLQYSLKHIGATTINKCQGETLPLGLAVEITKEYSPWEKGQIVVAMSRTKTAELTIIVGEKNYAIQKMWELILLFNQWTKYTDSILKMISINSSQNEVESDTFDYTSVYPFRLINGNVLPTDNTGYVYCLISKRHFEQIYIGETRCISQRLIQHNSGAGSTSTNNIRYRPWAVAAFICGLAHMNKSERMSLERRWKLYVEELQQRGQQDSWSWINIGEYLVQMYNSGSNSEKIRFIRLVTSD